MKTTTHIQKNPGEKRRNQYSEPWPSVFFSLSFLAQQETPRSDKTNCIITKPDTCTREKQVALRKIGLLLLIFLVTISPLVNCRAQVKLLSKQLEASMYAPGGYEIARKGLLNLGDSLDCVLVSLSETKSGTGTAQIIYEVMADENGFKSFDRQLANLGHISAKTVKTIDASKEVDTASITTDLVFARDICSAYENRLKLLAPDDPAYIETLEGFNNARAEVRDLERRYHFAGSLLQYPHKIKITLGS
ncbi:MAG: hypothetical protein V2A54_07525 [Bacteroidota bacterium]